MRLAKVLVGAVALGAVVVAFRDFGNRRWLRPALPGGEEEEEGGGFDVEEPVLGYDGMDRDTLIEWLEEANLDHDTLAGIRAYEAAHQNRVPVLDTLDDLLD